MRRCTEHPCCLTFNLVADGNRVVSMIHHSALPDVWNVAALLGC